METRRENKESRTDNKENKGSDPAKEKARSAQNIGGQTNGSIL